MEMIPYSRQDIGEEELNAVIKALSSPLITSGPAIELFEAELARYTGARFAVACNSGTAALHLCCLALGIGAEDVGITSPISFAASANCIEMCGGRASFVDIDERLCLDPNKLEDYCRTHKAPKVVVPVDFAGVPSKLSDLSFLSERYGFSIIEDAAHSLGSAYDSKGRMVRAGSCVDTDLAILSFHPVKTITTGEGGAVLTNNEDLARKLRLYRSHGIERDPERMSKNDGGWYYEMQELGFNYRLTDFQAALGSIQLSKIESFKARKKEIAIRYTQAFSDVPGIKTPPLPPLTDPCLHLYTARFDGAAKTRKLMYDYLKQRNIVCQVHYIPIHLQPYYSKKYGYTAGAFPAAEHYYDSCLSLPLFASMTDEQVSRVIEEVKAGLEECERL